MSANRHKQMANNDLEQRKQDILAATIEIYVATAAPVGSEAVSRKLRSSPSPATIRNVMADLEREGWLEQPHTSAGRVPTDRGYRVYVDHLMQSTRLSGEERRRLVDSLRAQVMDAISLLERAGVLLSEMTHQAAFIIAPTVKRSTVKQIELLPLGVHKLLCVLVGEEPFLISQTVDIDEPMTRDETVSIVRFLNHEMSGLPVAELVASLERRLLAGNDSLYYLVKRSLHILQAVLSVEPDERLVIEGATYLFDYPEFHQHPKKAHELLRHLELHDVLLERLRRDLVGHGPEQGVMHGDAVRVRIGREVGIEGLDDCSYIVSSLVLGPSLIGGVGILGPRRMDYRRMRAIVEGVADSVRRTISQSEPGHG